VIEDVSKLRSLEKGKMNTKPHNRPEIIETPDNAPETPSLSRRVFVLGAAGVCGVVAFRSLRSPSSVAAETAGSADTPGSVTIIQFSPDGKKIGKATVPRVIKADADWKQQLSPVSYDVTRHEGTERPYSGNTWDLHDHGLFRCICCDNALFSSDTKFESGTGWPSFWQPIARENILETSDSTIGMERTAVSCRECNAHLGHVFDDGPRPTGLRYCMNSAAMHFVKLA
jgi:peptide-methionine (R)-S-oxide reductase